MSEFEQIKATLKAKWLDYYEANQFWIKTTLPINNNGYVERKPLAYLILGSITAIEPKIKDWLKPFSELNKDPEALVRALGLPLSNLDQELEKRAKEIAEVQKAQINSIPSNSDTNYLNQFRETIKI